MRTRITLTHYDGKVKGDFLTGHRNVSHEFRWRIIGRFKTVDAAREARAQKVTPRYKRISL